MENLLESMHQRLAAGLKRNSLKSCSRWAREYINTPRGNLSFEFHPWEEEMHDSEAPVNVGQKAAQLGFSTAAIHRAFFYIDIHKLNVLYLLPTKTPDATDFSMTKFDPILESSPHLANLFSSVRNVGLKRAGPNTLWIRGMNSRSALKSIDPGLIILDELDEMPKDKIALAEIRTSGQRKLQYWKISTPTAPDFGIAKDMEDSTQEHYFFNCPSCKKRTELTFPECLKIEGEHLNDPAVKGSHIICRECGARLPSHFEDGIDVAKAQWLKEGNAKWEPTVPNPDFDKRGFYINQLYSMMFASRPEILAQWYFRAQNDPSAEQEFYNSRLGLAHVVDGARITDEMIGQAVLRGGGYLKLILPKPGMFITMGVDIGKWIHYNVSCWTFPRFANDLNILADCKVLDEGKVQSFNELGQIMQMYQPAMTVCDCEPEARAAYEFATNYPGRVKLCKYTKGLTESKISVPSSHENYFIKADRTAWLDATLGRFKTGRIMLPTNVSQEYQDHIKALIKRYRDNSEGNRTAYYLDTGPDHSAHAQCYAEIALPVAASLSTNQNIESFL